MELITEPINVRASRLSAQLLGKTNTKTSNLLYKENVLDALFVLYDECNNEKLKKNDKNISEFVNKYRAVMKELKNMRVNIYDFEVKNIIGRGYFGEVHLVKEKQTGDIYALKSIKKSECLDMKSSSFEEERNIMVTTQSKWHTTLQYSFQDSIYLYLAMEYHSGGDLLGLLSRQGGTIPESAATFYVSEIVIAIHDLHLMGFVHRDIKPDNILLDRLGHIKLADFGSSAKLTSRGVVSEGLPVGTPDYVAPEVLQSMDNKYKQDSHYTHLCDFWSLGVIAYQLTVGTTPFTSNSTTAMYSKIMNHSNNWKYPSDIVLSQAYVSLTKSLITDQTSRFDYEQIIKHDLFKNVDFNSLKDQVPPFVPKISSLEDTSNFVDVGKRKSQPDIENFKSKSQFSGRNLPFIGFTYTRESNERDSKEKLLSNAIVKDERVQNLLKDIDSLQRKLNNQKDILKEKENLERKFDDKSRKLESIQSVRDNLERDLANAIAECSNLKRTLELERKNQAEIERKALDLIKSAKMKWESAEKNKIDKLNLEIENQKRKIEEVTYANDILRNQLEQALEIKDMQKDSLEKVHSLNRRSVMGLESRLEILTTESHQRLCELENKLSEEVRSKKLLEHEINDLKKSETALSNHLLGFKETTINLKEEIKTRDLTIKDLEKKISKINDKDADFNFLRNEHEKMAKQLQETQKYRKEVDLMKIRLKEEQIRSKSLQDQIDSLKNDLECVERKSKVKIEKLKVEYEKSFKDLQDQLKKAVEDREKLEKELQNARAHIETNAIKVKTLEDLLARLESGVSKLENESERENVLKEQVERLEKQLVQAHETFALEKQELSQLKTKYWRMEKDLNNAEIDKRILKREIKEVEERTKQLTEDMSKLQNEMEEKKKTYESALLELSNLNENLATEVMKLQSSRRDFEENIKMEKERVEKERSVAEELRSALKEKEMKLAEVTKNLENTEREKKELEIKLEKNQATVNELLRNLDDLFKDKSITENEMEKYKREIQNVQKNSSALKEACSLLENQLVEYEKLHESWKSKENGLCLKIEKLLKDLTVAREEVQEAKRQANEEKSLRLLTETKNNRLQEDVECLEKECRSYKEQCCEFKNYSAGLSEELTATEEKINVLEANVRSLEREIENLQGEDRALKEDFSEQLTIMNKCKDINYDLLRQISEYKDENLALLDRIVELENIVVEKTNYYKDRELKSNATIQQQIKLIHFLQSKMEDQKKKKTFAGKLFGHSKKENINNYLLYQNNREVEGKVEEKEQLPRTVQSSVKKRKELNEIVENNFVKSSPSNKEKNNDVSKVNMEKCNLQKSSQITLSNGNDNGKMGSEQNGPENVIIEGWIKTPNKSNKGWEKMYASLTPSAFKIYSDYPKNGEMATPINCLELCKPETHGKVILEPLVSEVETPVDQEELSCVLKVEISPNTTCWPPKTALIMTSGQEEKEKWFKAFQSVLQGSEYKYVGETVISWTGEEIEMNCLVELSNGKRILGAEEGLYADNNGSLTIISGPTRVQQIVLLPPIHLALMIVDVKRYLVSCDLHLLESLSERDSVSKSSLPTKKINVMNNLSGFHAIHCSDFTRKRLACVATAKQLIVLKFDVNSRDFVPVRALDTAEPTSCMLFLEHSLLVGADKFFEVDLRTFRAEEFVDPSDPRLTHATAYCQRTRSFPLYVAAIVPEKEFVLCFNEFATFVDAFGRSTARTDREIKWTRLPRAFHYHAPYLYVVQFTAVEVFKIGRDASEPIESFRVEFGRPRLLGVVGSSTCRGGIYVGIDREVRMIEGKEMDDTGSSVWSVEDDKQEEGEEEEEEGEEMMTGSEFSFTSSMMQSLDGLSNDLDGGYGQQIGRSGGKKVKFPDL